MYSKAALVESPFAVAEMAADLAAEPAAEASFFVAKLPKTTLLHSCYKTVD